MAKLTQRDVSVTRLHNGAWLVAAMVNDQRVGRTYYGYSERDAIRAFVAVVNTPPKEARS